MTEKKRRTREEIVARYTKARNKRLGISDSPPPPRISSYDKAKWHLESVEEAGLPQKQAYVHTGIFLGWLIQNKLISKDFADCYVTQIERFLAREITGPDLFLDQSGCLTSDMLSEEGNRFTYRYYEKGQYIDDYIKTLAGGLSTEFHVEDTWENYDKMAAFISGRYADYRSSLTNTE